MVLAALKSRLWADTAKFTNLIAARFRKCKHLIREGKMLVKNKANVPSRVGCSRVVVV